MSVPAEGTCLVKNFKSGQYVSGRDASKDSETAVGWQVKMLEPDGIRCGRTRSSAPD